MRAIIVALVLQVASSLASAQSDCVEGVVVVRLDAGQQPSLQLMVGSPPLFGIQTIDDVLSEHGVITIRPFIQTSVGAISPAVERLLRTYVVYFSDSTSPYAVVNELLELSPIDAAFVNGKFTKYYGGTTKRVTPSDSWFADHSQWNLDNLVDDRRDIDAPEAWAIETGDPNLIIGIIDLGTMVDVSAGGILGNAPYALHPDNDFFFNPHEDQPGTGTLDRNDLTGMDSPVDPDTLRDNVIGTRMSAVPDFVTDPMEYRFWRSVPHNWILNQAKTAVSGDYQTHGINVASIAAAKATGGNNIAGIANTCKVYIVRDGTAAGESETSQLEEANAILHAAEFASVINMSWSFQASASEFFLEAIETAALKDRVLVSIAGNIGEGPGTTVGWPGLSPFVLCVGSIDSSLALDFYSRRGPLVGLVDVVAPVGAGIPVNSHNDCEVHPCPLNQQVLELFDRTSAAAPQAAGVAALVRSRFPGMTQDQVRSRIMNAAEWYWDQTQADTIKCGSGKINAYRALTEWGAITDNTLWTSNTLPPLLNEGFWINRPGSRDGKYFVSGDLTIEAGETLTIDAGVVVKIAPDHERTIPDLDRVQIIVKGSLIVNGTGLRPVVFESFVDGSQTSSDWLGIKVEPGGVASLSNVIIKNAVRAIENHAAITITSCTVVNCDAAIQAHANITATGLAISNTSSSNAAVNVVAGTGSFSSCSFTGTPRAIENSAPVTITNGSFTTCGSVLVGNASVTANGPSFIGNTGSPAIVLNSGSSTFTSCLFVNNTNAIENLAPVTLANCSFTNGGIAVTARSNLTSTGSVFANNTAALTAIDVYSGTASFTNCTLASNTGSAVAVRGSSTPTLNKCVTSQNGGPAVRAMEGWTGTPTMQNSIVFGNGTAVGSWTDAQWQANGQAVFNESPAFCNAGGGDYRLYAFSPAAAGPHFTERAGAFDIACAPTATITTVPASFLQACPQGDNSNLVISVDLDNAVMTRDVAANEIRLDIQDVTAKVFEDDGIVSASGPATLANGYTTSIQHEAFGYYYEGLADVLLNGFPLATRANLNIRTPDCQTAYGTINLADAGLFAAHNPSPPDPYNQACDFDDDGDSDVADFSFFGAHYNHSSTETPANVPSEFVSSSAHVTLQFTEEFPTATTHRLYVDVGVEDFGDVTASAFCFRPDNPNLIFAEWAPAQSNLGDVLFAPVIRDGVPQLFFVTVVSEGFGGASAHLGRLVFDVTDLEPLDNVAGDFVQTIADVMLESADTTATVTAQMGGVVQRAAQPVSARIYHNRLEQNFPNPFNPSTTIAYSLKTASNVNLTIFDVGGRRVRVLVNEDRERGAYKSVWDGRNDHGEAVSSGVYFYKLRAGSFTDTKKMTILK